MNQHHCGNSEIELVVEMRSDKGDLLGAVDHLDGQWALIDPSGGVRLRIMIWDRSKQYRYAYNIDL